MFGKAQTAHRLEDRRFLEGQGRYLDDISPAGCSAMFVLRSSEAHAKVLSIDVEVARAQPRVQAIITAEDLAEAHIGPLPCLARVAEWDWARPFLPPRPILAAERVRYVGEPIVAIVADTLDHARDAAALVMIEFESLPPLVDLDEALAAQTALWAEAPDNLCFDWSSGGREAVDAAFERAAHVVSVDVDNNRVAGMSLEPRGAIGHWDDDEQRYTLQVSSQGGHSIRRVLCQHVFGLPEERMRVITPDVGGAFGPKIFAYQEYALVLFAAERLGRPVKWVSDRGEALLSDTQGRAQRTHAELAVDDSGRFLAMRFDSLSDTGAYPGQHGPNIATVAGDGLHPSVYDIGVVYVRVRGVFTNTMSTDSYRGAGRPEVIYAVERLVDQAARQLGRDPVALRLANYVPRSAMPFTTVTGQRYDDGDFAALTRRAVKEAGFEQREALRAEAAARGKLLGLGLAYFIDRCGRGLDEFAELRFDGDGALTVYCGSQTNGQGHETAYADIVAERLGLDRAEIRVVQGDTDAVAQGRGTGGSRALAVGGNAVRLGALRMIERLGQEVARAFGCAPDALAFDDGYFSEPGTNRRLALAEAVALGIAEGEDIVVQAQYQPSQPTFPNGCHIAQIEIDAETGAIELCRYLSVNDVGVILNRTLVEGQFHGGLVQGISQALYERVVYDTESGQLLTGSLMDYYYPRAADFPGFELGFEEIACQTNPLGVKGCGEAGAIAAPPAVANAVFDALAGYDTSGLQMPFTADKLFAILRSGK